MHVKNAKNLVKSVFRKQHFTNSNFLDSYYANVLWDGTAEGTRIDGLWDPICYICNVLKVYNDFKMKENMYTKEIKILTTRGYEELGE